MVINRKPNQQSVIVDSLIIRIIQANTSSVLTVDCMEVSITGHWHWNEEGRKTLTGKAPRTAIAKATYLATTNRIEAGVIRFPGFRMYVT
jgi:hypothetical protein